MSTPGLIPSPEDLSPSCTPALPAPKVNINSLLARDEDLGLTTEEQQELENYQSALIILGPAAGAVLVCPGNQDNVADEDKCPYSSKCPLLRARKAPADRLCPIERKIVEERFGAWCREMETEPDTLNESNRVAISDLCWLDLQEQRCLHIVDKGEQARLTVTNPKDVHPETLLPISWEKVIHPNVELLVQLQTQRRLILKDWMLTPEQRWKKAKAENKGTGKDLSSKQSARADLLRKGTPAPPQV
jgi:hypothetical protein